MQHGNGNWKVAGNAADHQNANVSFDGKYDDIEFDLELVAIPSELFVSRLTPRPPSLSADGSGFHSGFVLGDVEPSSESDDDIEDDDDNDADHNNDTSICFDSEEVDCCFSDAGVVLSMSPTPSALMLSAISALPTTIPILTTRILTKMMAHLHLTLFLQRKE